jgi:Na+-driven multidrug efflux pump
LLRPVIHAFSLSPEAAALALGVLTLYCAVTFFAWPLSFTLPCALRGAGDARFTMVVSIASMLLFRVALSYLLTPRMGLSGVWAAMYVDWGVRSAFFLWRFHGKRWESIKVI